MVEVVLIGCGLAIAIVGTISFMRILWRFTNDMTASTSNTQSNCIGFEVSPNQSEEEEREICK